MWRVVMRPLLLRPPVFLRISTSDFSGLDLVISSNDGNALKRLVGVRGRKVLRAMAGYVLGKFDLFAFLEGHDRLLPVGFATESGGALALLLAGVVRGINGDHGLLEE